MEVKLGLLWPSPEMFWPLDLKWPWLLFSSQTFCYLFSGLNCRLDIFLIFAMLLNTRSHHWHYIIYPRLLLHVDSFDIFCIPISCDQIPVALTAEMEAEKKQKESEKKKAQKKAKQERLKVSSVCACVYFYVSLSFPVYWWLKK